MKNSIWIIIVSIFTISCNNLQNRIDFDENIKLDTSYALFFELYNDIINYEMPNIKNQKFDTAKVLTVFDTNLNHYSQVFVFDNDKPILNFGICECEKNEDNLLIILKPIQNKYKNASDYSNKIEIKVGENYFETKYFTSYYNKKNAKVIYDTIQINYEELKLSQKISKIGDVAIGEICLYTEIDTIKGKFKIEVEADRNLRDTNFTPITDNDIYDFMNNCYIKFCRDTSEIKKIFEYQTQGNINKAYKPIFESYLISVEKYSQKEIDFLKTQLPKSNTNSYNNLYDTSWIWKTDRIENAKIVYKNEIDKIKNNDSTGLANSNMFRTKFENGFVFVSKPLISNDRKIVIINEYFETNSWCGTGKSRSFIFKKIGKIWTLIYLLYD